MNEQANITNDDSLGKSSTDNESSDEPWLLKMKENSKALQLQMEENNKNFIRKLRWATIIVLLTLMLSMVIISASVLL